MLYIVPTIYMEIFNIKDTLHIVLCWFMFCLVYSTIYTFIIINLIFD